MDQPLVYREKQTGYVSIPAVVADERFQAVLRTHYPKRKIQFMKNFIAAALLLLSLNLSAQTPEFTADTADVNSINGIVTALYDVITGPAGPRDWARFRSLFKPTAQLNAKVFNMNGKSQFVQGDVNDYIANVDEYFVLNGFFEKEIGRQVHVYHDIAQVFSAYDARLATNQGTYHRGINSLQLIYDNNRWWIVNMLYNMESVKTPLPNEFLFPEHQKK
jgi:hypothetical protein